MSQIFRHLITFPPPYKNYPIPQSPMMQPANHPPRIIGCSLSTFNSTYINIVTRPIIDHADYYRACILGLSGKDIKENIQYSIEPTRNRFRAPREVSVVRDYDSFLSFTESLPVKADLFLYPINNPIDTLRSSLHFKVPMSFHDSQVNFPHLDFDIALTHTYLHSLSHESHPIVSPTFVWVQLGSTPKSGCSFHGSLTPTGRMSS
jgi:hypothetical protein